MPKVLQQELLPFVIIMMEAWYLEGVLTAPFKDLVLRTIYIDLKLQ